jgi:hypothetical protein
VLDAEKPTEMGKNVDGSDAGTANSIEPLETNGQEVLATALRTLHETKNSEIALHHIPAVGLVNKNN